MIRVRISEDLDECGRLWQNHLPRTCFFDLWPVRACFQKQFNRPPCFLIAEQQGRITGFLALSWIEERQCFAHFPGETWQEKTWLEQNKIVAENPVVYQTLLNHIPGSAEIRYIPRESILLDEDCFSQDEIGYLFFPKAYGNLFHSYLQEFSGKSRKKLGRELDGMTSLGLRVRYDHAKDIEHMFRMNLETFRELSYFSDARFLDAFEALMTWLRQENLLRITTILLGGKIAAVDVGAVWNSTYTILAGGTHPDFPGVAKLINFHHIEWSCLKRLEIVDFLCGNFGWKQRFHLFPRPLFSIHLPFETAFDRYVSARTVCA